MPVRQVAGVTIKANISRLRSFRAGNIDLNCAENRSAMTGIFLPKTSFAAPINPAYKSEQMARIFLRNLLGILMKNSLTVAFSRFLSTARSLIWPSMKAVTITTKSLCPFFMVVSSLDRAAGPGRVVPVTDRPPFGPEKRGAAFRDPALPPGSAYESGCPGSAGRAIAGAVWL
jgi:hypothetical protein